MSSATHERADEGQPQGVPPDPPPHPATSPTPGSSTMRAIGPGDFRGVPQLPRLAAARSRPVQDPTRPLPAFKLVREIRAGRVGGRRSLADALASLAGAPPAARPGPRCDRCRDAGHLVADVPYGDPAFGRLIPCPGSTFREVNWASYRGRFGQ